MSMHYSFQAVNSAKPRPSSVIRIAGYLVLTVALCACSPRASEQELLDRARQAMEQGEARSAEIDAKTVLQQNPDNVQARRLVAESYLYQQNPVAAVDEFQRVLEAGEEEEVRVLYAQAVLGAGRSKLLLELDAQGGFDNVSEQPRYLATLARAQAIAGDLQIARETLDAALAAGPDDPYVATFDAFFLLAYSEAPDEALAVLQTTLASHPEHADAWSLQGGIQQMQGESGEAENSFARAVELNSYRFSDLLSLITVRIDQDKTEEAAAQLERLLANNPDHPGLNFLQGRLLVEAGENSQALAAFFKVLNELPDHVGSLYLAAIANIGEGNLATARGQLNRLLSLQPENLSGRLLLSNLHLLMDDPEAAEEVASSLIQYDDINYSAMAVLAAARGAQGRSETENLELYERMTTARPEAVEPRLALASALLEAGEADAGIAQFQAARDLAPRSADVRGRLIQAHLSRGDITAAKAEAETFAEQQPDNPRARIYLARIAMQENDIAAARAYFGEAEEQLREALEGQPDNLELNSLLLNALMGQGKLEEADTVLAGLPEEAATRPAVLVARGRIALAVDKPADAEGLLRSAMDTSPNSMTLMWLTGAISAQGREDEAIELLNDWLEDNPADAIVHNELASSYYLQMGRDQEAREHYQEVVSLAPDNVIVLNNLAWLLRKDNPEQALAYIERAAELVQGNPQVMDTHAMIQLELGATEEALALNTNVLELMPGNPETRYHRALILRADGQTEQAVQILESLVEAEEVAESRKEQARALLVELQGR